MKQVFVYFIVSFLLLSLTSSASKDHSVSKISIHKRNQWIKKQSVMLKNFIPDATIEKAAISENEFANGIKLTVDINNKSYLVTKDNGWIYFITHSTHDNPKVGDITLAIDHNKNIFMNEGHVCGGFVSFSALNFKEIKSVSDFFQYFKSEEKNIEWKKLP